MGLLISEGYRGQLRQLHASDPTWGEGDPWFTDLTRQVAELAGAETILDYGAGKAVIPGVSRYDPGIEGLDDAPLPCDLVVSRCVLEHVEPDHLDAVLDHMRLLSRQAVLLVVSCFPSGKKLPDGRNVHLIVEDLDWWLPHLMARWSVNNAQRLRHKRLLFIGKTK